MWVLGDATAALPGPGAQRLGECRNFEAARRRPGLPGEIL